MSDVLTVQSTSMPASQSMAAKKQAPTAKATGLPLAGASREAKRLAALILEVLAGMRTPTDAAAVLGSSLPRYYTLETRALSGLLHACEPRGKGRVSTPENQLSKLRREYARLQRACARHQALARAAQRTVGLTPPAPALKKAGKKRRRPTVRALQIAARIGSAVEAESAVSSALSPSDNGLSP